jgi:hypothetical protein
MENNLTNFVWFFIGTEVDPYLIYDNGCKIGEQKKYCLIEYSVNDDSLKLNNFTKKSLPWNSLNNLNYYETKIINKMIDDGVRLLYKIDSDNDEYGYICNIFDGKYIFSNEENQNIKNKLKELLYNKNIHFCNIIEVSS